MKLRLSMTAVLDRRFVALGRGVLAAFRLDAGSWPGWEETTAGGPLSRRFFLMLLSEALSSSLISSR